MTCCRPVSIEYSIEGRDGSLNLRDFVVHVGVPESLSITPLAYFLEGVAKGAPMRAVHAKGVVRTTLEVTCNNACVSRMLGVDKVGPDVIRARYVLDIDPVSVTVMREKLVVDGVEAELYSSNGTLYLRAAVQNVAKMFEKCGSREIGVKMEDALADGIRLQHSSIIELYRDIEAARRLKLLPQALKSFILRDECLLTAALQALRSLTQPLLIGLYTTLSYVASCVVADERYEEMILDDETAEQASVIASKLLDKKIAIYNAGKPLVEVEGLVYTVRALPDRFRKAVRASMLLAKGHRMVFVPGLDPNWIDIGELERIAREEGVIVILTA